MWGFMTLFLYGLSEARRNDWTPSVDVYRTPDGWVLKFDVAGVGPEDFTVELEGSQVRVRGVRRDRTLQRGWSHYSMEISYCRFERSVRLPSSLEGCRIASEYRDGLLIVRIDKRMTK